MEQSPALWRTINSSHWVPDLMKHTPQLNGLPSFVMIPGPEQDLRSLIKLLDLGLFLPLGKRNWTTFVQSWRDRFHKSYSNVRIGCIQNVAEWRDNCLRLISTCEQVQGRHNSMSCRKPLPHRWYHRLFNVDHRTSRTFNVLTSVIFVWDSS